MSGRLFHLGQFCFISISADRSAIGDLSKYPHRKKDTAPLVGECGGAL
jgi:hypothetical protein